MPADGWWTGRPLAETRWSLELMRLLGDPVMRGTGVPRGDGRGVLLLPGLLAGDQTLSVLAGWLKTIGYRPATNRMITNIDCGDRVFDDVIARAEALAARTGRRIAVVGHSRGGHHARALAVERPDLVSHVVSLGAGLRPTLDISSPTLLALDALRLGARATGRARHPACMTEECGCRYAQQVRAVFPTDDVRLYSLYSKGDGVVRWRAQIVEEATCIEVTGSHIGLVFNRKVYRKLAKILITPELPHGGAPSRAGGPHTAPPARAVRRARHRG